VGESGFLLAMAEDERSEAAAGVIGMNKDGADFCGVGGGIEESRFAAGAVITAEESPAIAPAAAAGDNSGLISVARWVKRFSDEVGPVFDELGVETESVAECTFDLCESVVVLLQFANRLLNQRAQRGDINRSGNADSIGTCRRHRAMIAEMWICVQRNSQVYLDVTVC